MPELLRRRRHWRLAVAAVGLTLLLLLSHSWQSASRRRPATVPATVQHRLGIEPGSHDNDAVQISRFGSDSPQLAVGIQLKNVYNLRLENQTFSADGWYWMRWGEDLEAIRRDEAIPVLAMLEFLNQVEVWDSRIEPETSEPVVEADGNFYQLFRFSGRFYIDLIDQRHSPFETIVLPIVLETRPDSFNLSRHAVLLEPDRQQKVLISNYTDLTGYSLLRGWSEQRSNTYSIARDNSPEVYSQIAVRMLYRSEPWAAFMKWILPLLIVMSIVLLAPSLEGSLGDMRLTIPSTALLTLVFMQQTYKSELPSTPYLTFLDQLYAYSYIVALGLFILFLWGTNLMEAVPADQRQATRLRINRIDSRCQLIASWGMVLVAILAWFV